VYDNNEKIRKKLFTFSHSQNYMGRLTMESIVKKLSEIESAASAIVEHAEAQKEVLDHEYREKRNRFDTELEAKTSKKILEIQSDLASKTDALLKAQIGGRNDTIAALEQEYEKRHTWYAQNILKRITEV
jgi:hypothetical protein